MIYAYIRVSHRDSAESGLSVEAQRKAIRRFCERKFGERPQEFIDLAESAWSKTIYQRPEGGKLCRLLKEGDHVVFYRLDRGFRSVPDFSATIPMWIEKGVGVHLMDQKLDLTTANGKLFAHVAAAHAQWKSDITSERVRLSKAQPKKDREKKEKFKSEPSIFVHRPKERRDDKSVVRVFSYARVSHINSVEGYSLGAQKDSIDGYLSLYEMPEAIHYEDRAISAFTYDFCNRPAGRELDGELRKGDHVVFARLDRVWRSTLDMAKTWDDWKARGITVHFADTCIDTGTASGVAFIEMLAVFAKWESADTSERIRAVLEGMREKGLVTNKDVPRGLKVSVRRGVKKMVPDIQFLRDIWLINLYLRQGMTKREAAEQMEKVVAEREGRSPMPVTGVHPAMLHKFIPSVRMRHRYRLDRQHKGLVLPPWSLKRISKTRQAEHLEAISEVFQACRRSVGHPRSHVLPESIAKGSSGPSSLPPILV